jgi:very-short-patch-repair endonuclease
MDKKEFIKKAKEKLEGMNNEELFKYFEKTDKNVIPYMFNEEYKNFINAANPNYGEGSKQLYEDLKDIKKKDLIILTVFNSDIEKENLSKKNIQFIPFDKIFIQTAIPFIDSRKQFCIIESLMLIKSKEDNLIRIHYIAKYVKDLQRKQVGNIGMKENELNLQIKNDEKSFEKSEYPGLEQNEMQETLNNLGDKLRKIIRYVSYKLTTHEYKTYHKCENGKLIEKEIVFSSEVKSHKRHFWEDSGKFIIPTLPKQEIIDKGYFIDELVFKDGQLRQNVPYTIIGNFTKNKELEKKNREINLFRKRILRQEEKIYSILRELFPNKFIKRNDRRTLKGLELDFNIPELRLGIEYDGEQHFDKQLYKKLYGDGFDAQVKRDKIKDKLCKRKNIKLVRIKYDEPLTKTNIKNKIKEVI